MNVIDLSEPADDPDIVLQAAIGELADVCLVGIDKDGKLYVAGSLRDPERMLVNFERAASYIKRVIWADDNDCETYDDED